MPPERRLIYALINKTKSGNAFTNFIAYGTERSKALASQHAAEQAMKQKGCSSDPAKIDNKPESGIFI